MPDNDRFDLGSRANEAAALAYVQARLWDVGGTGATNPVPGTFFYDSTAGSRKWWDGAAWVVIGGMSAPNIWAPSFAGATNDFKTTPTDPVTGFVASGDVANMDTLERSAAGIRYALAGAGAGYYVSVSRDFPAATAYPMLYTPAYSCILKVTVTTLSLHNGNGLLLYIHDGSGANESDLVQFRRGAANYEILGNAKRNGGGNAIPTVGFVNMIGTFFFGVRADLEQTQCFIQTDGTPAQFATALVNAVPRNRITGGTVRVQLDANIPAGASVDLLIEEIVAQDLPLKAT